MPPRASSLTARRRWSIVIGACMASITIAGSAAALFMTRQKIICYGAWEHIAEGVTHRYCDRRPRMGGGESSSFVELRFEPEDTPPWYLEQTEGLNLVIRTENLVLVPEMEESDPWLGDLRLAAYRFDDGRREWGATLPRPPGYIDPDLPCDPGVRGPSSELLAELDGTLVFMGSLDGEISVIGIDRADGQVRWNRALGSIGVPDTTSVQDGALLIPSFSRDVLYRVDSDGDLTMSTRPMRSAASCLELTGFLPTLDPNLASWLEDDNARIDCMPAGPRTFVVARAGTRTRVLLLAPDGALRMKEERREAEVRLPFDGRCIRHLYDQQDDYRTIAWLERPSPDEDWELILLDTRLREELRFGLPGWQPMRSEASPYTGGWAFEGRVEAYPYLSMRVLRGAPRILVREQMPVHLEPRGEYGDGVVVVEGTY